MDDSEIVKLLELILSWRYPDSNSKGIRFYVNAEHPWCEQNCVIVFLYTTDAPYCMADFSVNKNWLSECLVGKGFRGLFDMIESIYRTTDEVEKKMTVIEAQWYANNKAN